MIYMTDNISIKITDGFQKNECDGFVFNTNRTCISRYMKSGRFL